MIRCRAQRGGCGQPKVRPRSPSLSVPPPPFPASPRRRQTRCLIQQLIRHSLIQSRRFIAESAVGRPSGGMLKRPVKTAGRVACICQNDVSRAVGTLTTSNKLAAAVVGSGLSACSDGCCRPCWQYIRATGDRRPERRHRQPPGARGARAPDETPEGALGDTQQGQGYLVRCIVMLFLIRKYSQVKEVSRESSKN